MIETSRQPILEHKVDNISTSLSAIHSDLYTRKSASATYSVADALSNIYENQKNKVDETAIVTEKYYKGILNEFTNLSDVLNQKRRDLSIQDSSYILSNRIYYNRQTEDNTEVKYADITYNETLKKIESGKLYNIADDINVNNKDLVDCLKYFYNGTVDEGLITQIDGECFTTISLINNDFFIGNFETTINKAPHLESLHSYNEITDNEKEGTIEAEDAKGEKIEKDTPLVAGATSVVGDKKSPIIINPGSTSSSKQGTTTIGSTEKLETVIPDNIKENIRQNVTSFKTEITTSEFFYYTSSYTPIFKHIDNNSNDIFYTEIQDDKHLAELYLTAEESKLSENPQTIELAYTAYYISAAAFGIKKLKHNILSEPAWIYNQTYYVDNLLVSTQPHNQINEYYFAKILSYNVVASQIHNNYEKIYTGNWKTQANQLDYKNTQLYIIRDNNPYSTVGNTFNYIQLAYIDNDNIFGNLGTAVTIGTDEVWYTPSKTEHYPLFYYYDSYNDSYSSVFTNDVILGLKNIGENCDFYVYDTTDTTEEQQVTQISIKDLYMSYNQFLHHEFVTQSEEETYFSSYYDDYDITVDEKTYICEISFNKLKSDGYITIDEHKSSDNDETKYLVHIGKKQNIKDYIIPAQYEIKKFGNSIQFFYSICDAIENVKNIITANNIDETTKAVILEAEELCNRYVDDNPYLTSCDITLLNTYYSNKINEIVNYCKANYANGANDYSLVTSVFNDTKNLSSIDQYEEVITDGDIYWQDPYTGEIMPDIAEVTESCRTNKPILGFINNVGNQTVNDLTYYAVCTYTMFTVNNSSDYYDTCYLQKDNTKGVYKYVLSKQNSSNYILKESDELEVVFHYYIKGIISTSKRIPYPGDFHKIDGHFDNKKLFGIPLDRYPFYYYLNLSKLGKINIDNSLVWYKDIPAGNPADILDSDKGIYSSDYSNCLTYETFRNWYNTSYWDNIVLFYYPERYGFKTFDETVNINYSNTVNAIIRKFDDIAALNDDNFSTDFFNNIDKNKQECAKFVSFEVSKGLTYSLEYFDDNYNIINANNTITNPITQINGNDYIVDTYTLNISTHRYILPTIIDAPEWNHTSETSTYIYVNKLRYTDSFNTLVGLLTHTDFSEQSMIPSDSNQGKVLFSNTYTLTYQLNYWVAVQNDNLINRPTDMPIELNYTLLDIADDSDNLFTTQNEGNEAGSFYININAIIKTNKGTIYTTRELIEQYPIIVNASNKNTLAFENNEDLKNKAVSGSITDEAGNTINGILTPFPFLSRHSTGTDIYKYHGIIQVESHAFPFEGEALSDIIVKEATTDSIKYSYAIPYALTNEKTITKTGNYIYHEPEYDYRLSYTVSYIAFVKDLENTTISAKKQEIDYRYIFEHKNKLYTYISKDNYVTNEINTELNNKKYVTQWELDQEVKQQWYNDFEILYNTYNTYAKLSYNYLNTFLQYYTPLCNIMAENGITYSDDLYDWLSQRKANIFYCEAFKDKLDDELYDNIYLSYAPSYYKMNINHGGMLEKKYSFIPGLGSFSERPESDAKWKEQLYGEPTVIDKTIYTVKHYGTKDFDITLNVSYTLNISNYYVKDSIIPLINNKDCLTYLYVTNESIKKHGNTQEDSLFRYIYFNNTYLPVNIDNLQYNVLSTNIPKRLLNSISNMDASKELDAFDSTLFSTLDFYEGDDIVTLNDIIQGDELYYEAQTLFGASTDESTDCDDIEIIADENNFVFDTTTSLSSKGSVYASFYIGESITNKQVNVKLLEATTYNGKTIASNFLIHNNTSTDQYQEISILLTDITDNSNKVHLVIALPKRIKIPAPNAKNGTKYYDNTFPIEYNNDNLTVTVTNNVPNTVLFTEEHKFNGNELTIDLTIQSGSITQVHTRDYLFVTVSGITGTLSDILFEDYKKNPFNE